MFKSFKFGGLKVGHNSPCLIVAEISANHNGKLSNALKLIKAAKNAGADAIKFQTYTPDNITLNSFKEDFLIQKKSPWAKHKNLYNLYNHAQTPRKWHKKLKDYSKKINIEFFSTPFDISSVDFLNKLNVNIFKIASPEINDNHLIKKIIRTKKPIIISTGLSDLKLLKKSVNFIKKNGCKKLIILKCLTSYPAPVSESNLLTMIDMQKKFNCIVGISDHSIGFDVPCTAVAMGAKLVEKHLKLNNTLKTADSFFSMNPQNFAKMVKKIRKIEQIRGKVDYRLSVSAKKNKNSIRSIYVSKNIQIGEKFTKKNIRSVRPGYSLSPDKFDEILQKKSKKKLTVGDRILIENIY